MFYYYSHFDYTKVLLFFEFHKKNREIISPCLNVLKALHSVLLSAVAVFVFLAAATWTEIVTADFFFYPDRFEFLLALLLR